MHDCLIAGFRRGYEKQKESWQKRVSKHEIIIKFKCYYDENEPTEDGMTQLGQNTLVLKEMTHSGTAA